MAQDSKGKDVLLFVRNTDITLAREEIAEAISRLPDKGLQKVATEILVNGKEQLKTTAQLSASQRQKVSQLMAPLGITLRAHSAPPVAGAPPQQSPAAAEQPGQPSPPSPEPAPPPPAAGPEQEGETPLYYSISTWQLALLSIFTFGLFELYWFYQNWKILEKRRQDVKINPLLYTLLAKFSCFLLFNDIATQAQKSEQEEIKHWPPILLFIIYAGSLTLWRAPEPYSYLVYLSPIPLLLAQGPMNQLNRVLTGLPEPGGKMTAKHWGTIAACLIAWWYIHGLPPDFKKIMLVNKIMGPEYHYEQSNRLVKHLCSKKWPQRQESISYKVCQEYQQAAAQVALEAETSEARKWALSVLNPSRQETLQQVCLHDPDMEVRRESCHKVTDQNFLGEVLLNEQEAWQVKELVIRQVTERFILEDFLQTEEVYSDEQVKELDWCYQLAEKRLRKIIDN